MVWVDGLATLILVVLLGLLSPIILIDRRWGIRAIPYLVLSTSTVVAPLNRAAFPGVMSGLATGVVGHPRLIIGLLASTCVIEVVVV